MDLTGYTVYHKKFGLGTVEEVCQKRITVQFEKDSKAFVYPDTFEEYLILTDETAKKYMDEILTELEKKKLTEIERKRLKKRRINMVSSLKIRKDSHVIFGFKDNNLKDVLETWTISTGTYASGKSKGKPRIPNRLNINSACLLTIKPEEQKEEDRIIIGAFMVADDFKGEKCTDGIIPAHKEHRIILTPDDGEIPFWDYLTETKTKKWGVSEMKYCSETLVKKVLEDMIKKITDMKSREKAVSFYHYFCTLNRL